MWFLRLAVLWAARLWLYLLVRTAGKPEDRRYADMRRRYDPGFWWKSLFIVFAFQALLAWIISLPLFGVEVHFAAIGGRSGARLGSISDTFSFDL